MLRRCKALIWDLDNTLYRCGEITEQVFHLAVAKTAIEQGVDLSLEEATSIAEKSWYDHGASYMEFCLSYGFDTKDFCNDFHKEIDEKVLTPCTETPALFASIDAKHAIVTQAARSWAGRVVAHLGLKDSFPDEKVLCIEDYDFQKKSESTVPFEKALKLLDSVVSETLVIEDALRNLSVPKDMGMGTVYIHHGKPLADLPSYVDAQYETAKDFLKELERTQIASSIRKKKRA